VTVDLIGAVFGCGGCPFQLGFGFFGGPIGLDLNNWALMGVDSKLGLGLELPDIGPNRSWAKILKSPKELGLVKAQTNSFLLFFSFFFFSSHPSFYSKHPRFVDLLTRVVLPLTAPLFLFFLLFFFTSSLCCI
jgi:hypothetical protein